MCLCWSLNEYAVCIYKWTLERWVGVLGSWFSFVALLCVLRSTWVYALFSSLCQRNRTDHVYLHFDYLINVHSGEIVRIFLMLVFLPWSWLLVIYHPNQNIFIETILQVQNLWYCGLVFRHECLHWSLLLRSFRCTSLVCQGIDYLTVKLQNILPVALNFSDDYLFSKPGKFIDRTSRKLFVTDVR